MFCPLSAKVERYEQGPTAERFVVVFFYLGALVYTTLPADVMQEIIGLAGKKTSCASVRTIARIVRMCASMRMFWPITEFVV